MPVSRVEWQEFMQAYSADSINGATARELDLLSETQRARHWMGSAPAVREAAKNSRKTVAGMAGRRDGATSPRGYFASLFADVLLPSSESDDTMTTSDYEILAARAARYVPPALPETTLFQQGPNEARRLICSGENDTA
jgi:hypothetical protein